MMVKTTNLTNDYIGKLTPQKSVYLVYDTIFERLCIEVHPNGEKLWLFVPTLENQEEIRPLGRFPETQVEDARVKARATEERVATGFTASSAMAAAATARVKVRRGYPPAS